jgi:hypothetical protein
VSAEQKAKLQLVKKELLGEMPARKRNNNI